MPISPFSANGPFNDPKDQKPSLSDKLKNSGARASQPPRPKPFDMTEPFQQPGGLWGFWLTADDPILKYVGNLNCVMNTAAPPFSRPHRGRMLFSINPRYDHEEAWMWIHRMLESETEVVELDEMWSTALEDEGEGDRG